MRNILSALLAVAWLATAAWSAQANEGLIAYKPGTIKAAVERGETVLLHSKSTW